MVSYNNNDMSRAISNKNVLAAQFETADFNGPYLASFGRPELRGAWIIWGESGSGKTTFMLMLCKYLCKFRRVAYNSLEQGLSLSLQKAWERVGMEEAGSQIILLNKESMADLRVRLRKRKSPEVVVIDSVQYLIGWKWQDYAKLKDEFPDKLFIFISQADKSGKDPDSNIAKKIRYDADIKIRVEGYKAFVTTRYEVPELGEGGQDFTIWQEGADAYWLNQIK